MPFFHVCVCVLRVRVVCFALADGFMVFYLLSLCIQCTDQRILDHKIDSFFVLCSVLQSFCVYERVSENTVFNANRYYYLYKQWHFRWNLVLFVRVFAFDVFFFSIFFDSLDLFEWMMVFFYLSSKLTNFQLLIRKLIPIFASPNTFYSSFDLFPPITLLPRLVFSICSSKRKASFLLPLTFSFMDQLHFSTQ